MAGLQIRQAAVTAVPDDGDARRPGRGQQQGGGLPGHRRTPHHQPGRHVVGVLPASVPRPLVDGRATRDSHLDAGGLTSILAPRLRP